MKIEGRYELAELHLATKQGVVAHIPVGDTIRQFFGLLHAGASVALAEIFGGYDMKGQLISADYYRVLESAKESIDIKVKSPWPSLIARRVECSW